jgi:hypothetical protein
MGLDESGLQPVGAKPHECRVKAFEMSYLQNSLLFFGDAVEFRRLGDGHRDRFLDQNVNAGGQ